MSNEGAVSNSSRRSASREATLREISAAARDLLVRDGVEGVTLRPIAKAVGLTAPALYRYFPGREQLLRALIADLYDELITDMETARDKESEIPRRLLGITHAFRRWGLVHPAEFRLVFATRIDMDQPDCVTESGGRFGAVFLGLFVELWAHRPFPIKDDGDVDPRLLQQLAAWPEAGAAGLPIGALEVFMACWVRIYGLISLEVFGHLAFALVDGTPMFDTMLAEMATMLALPWSSEYATSSALIDW